MTVVETGNHYEDIPGYIFASSDSILDIGNCGGVNFCFSHHASHLERCQYLGIDIEPPEQSPLPTITADVLQWDNTEQYDLVIALHIVEHIDFNEWEDLFKRLKSWTRKYLVIGVPYKESQRHGWMYEGPPEPHKHKVYQISKGMLSKFLPDARFHVHTEGYFSSHFNANGASLPWAVLRLIKRIITRHAYARIRRLLAIWEKNDHVELSPDKFQLDEVILNFDEVEK